MKLNMANQAVPTDAIMADTLAPYDLVPASWQVTAEGIGNVVVRATATDGADYFVKYYNAGHARGRVEDEVAFTGFLASAGVPVPEYVSHSGGALLGSLAHPNGENVVTVTRRMEGEHPKGYTALLLGQLARSHAHMHQESTGWPRGAAFDPIRDYNYYQPEPHETELVNLQSDMSPVIERVQDAWATLPSGMTHLDVVKSNVLTKDDNLSGIIDFEDVSVAPYVFCLAGTLWDIYVSGGTPEDIKDYIAAYETRRELSAEERAILPDMAVLRGWIALHGSLLTQGPESESSLKQMKLLAESYASGTFMS